MFPGIALNREELVNKYSFFQLCGMFCTTPTTPSLSEPQAPAQRGNLLNNIFCIGFYIPYFLYHLPTPIMVLPGINHSNSNPVSGSTSERSCLKTLIIIIPSPMTDSSQALLPLPHDHLHWKVNSSGNSAVDSSFLACRWTLALFWRTVHMCSLYA